MLVQLTNCPADTTVHGAMAGVEEQIAQRAESPVEECDEHRVECGVGLAKFLKGGFGQNTELGGLDGACGGGARIIGQQRLFTDQFAFADDGDSYNIAVLGSSFDDDVARIDHECGIGGVALPEQNIAAAQTARTHRRQQALTVWRAQLVE